MRTSQLSKLFSISLLLLVSSIPAFAVDKVIDGGTGTDTVTLSYTGITGLQSFVTREMNADETVLTLVDANNNTITLANIIDFTTDANPTAFITAGSSSYIFSDFPVGTGSSYYQRASCSMHAHDYGGTFGVAVDRTNNIAVTYANAETFGPADGASNNDVCSVLFTYNRQESSSIGPHTLRKDYASTPLTIYGYSHTDYIRATLGADTIYTFGGNDQVAGKDGADTIDLGEGDDVAFVILSDLTEDTLIGGDGIDTLSFARVRGTSGKNYGETYEDMNHNWNHDFAVTAHLGDLLTDSGKSISGFENLVGSHGADTLTGDNNNNVLVGGYSNDVLTGLAGNDTLYDDVNTPLNSADGFANTDIYGQSIQSPGNWTDYTYGNDTLYGNAGNDILIASTGEDTLDGGEGADTLTGGAGADTFIIRSGDGGSSISDADTITDFTDGTDLIGMDGLTYNNLTREASGNDVVIKYNNEVLTTISNTALDNINYYDITSTSTDAQTLTGTSDDDILLGSSGNDTFTTGTGTDVVVGYGGNDDITINGAGNKTIDGGTGTDTVTLSYTGITGLQSFVTREMNADETVLTLVDANNNTITLANIIDFTTDANPTAFITAGSSSYIFSDFPVGTGSSYYQRASCSMHAHDYGGTFGVAVDRTNNIAVTYANAETFGPADGASNNDVCSVLFTYNRQESSSIGPHTLRKDYASTPLTIYGYSHTDYIRATLGADTIYTFGGNDQVAGKDGADTIDLGEGDDVAFVILSDLTEDTLIGGDGIDTLSFARVRGTSGKNYGETYEDMNHNWNHDFAVTAHLGDLLTDSGKSISGFENLVGSHGADTLTGDNNNNVLVGGYSNDVLTGLAGNDTLYDDVNTPLNSADGFANTDIYGQSIQSPGNWTDYTYGNDTLYGNAGNDILIASTGEDTLDGGEGADTLTGGAGADTFIIRSGDGGSSISDADTITDFTDGTDLIGMDGLTYNNLTREASGNDVVIKYNNEVLTTISNTALDNINYYDITSTSTDAQTLTGTSDDDILLGSSGNDTFTTGTGTDVVVGYGGNDDITINGAGNKTIDGGTGTDTVTLSYTGITGLQSFVTREMNADETVLTLVDANNNTITLANIIDFTTDANPTAFITAGSSSYIFSDFPVGTGSSYYQRASCSMHAHDYGGTFGVAVDRTNNIAVTYANAETFGPADGASNNDVCSVLFTYNRQESSSIGPHTLRKDYASTPLTIYGYSHTDYIRATLGADTIYTFGGNDQVAGKDGADTIDLGEGDDVAFVILSDLTEDTLIGGDGIDTLSFARVRGTSGKNYGETYEDMNHNWNHDFAVTAHLGDLLTDSGKSISGFENLVGSHGADTLTGDNNNNVLVGGYSNDVLTGLAGNDTLYDDVNTPLNSADGFANTDIYGQSIQSPGNWTDYTYGNDTLYGNAGNDILIASTGEDTLDGGEGADTLTGGAGADTFIIRSGDGGSSISDADTITDFTDGTDLIGMDGLTYSDLTIEQGTGSYSSHVVVKKTDTGEFLIVIQNTSLSSISDADFSAI